MPGTALGSPQNNEPLSELGNAWVTSQLVYFPTSCRALARLLSQDMAVTPVSQGRELHKPCFAGSSGRNELSQSDDMTGQTSLQTWEERSNQEVGPDVDGR